MSLADFPRSAYAGGTAIVCEVQRKSGQVNKHHSLVIQSKNTHTTETQQLLIGTSAKVLCEKGVNKHPQKIISGLPYFLSKV